MKVVIVLLFTIAATLAEPPAPQYLPPSNQYGPPSGNGGGQRPGPGPQYGAPKPQYGAPSGNGGGYDDQEAPASYQYSYMVQDAESGVDFGAEEQREGDVAKGKYYVLLPDGRKQVVEYTADSEGYKPMVTYEGQANGGGYPKGPSGNGGYPRGGNGGYQY